MSWIAQLKTHRIPLTLLGIALILGGIIVGWIVNPTLIYDQWIWKYYWGPVVSDAAGYPVTYNGITAYEGYTYVSEITYGILLLISIYAVYQLLKKLKIKVDWRFCLALLPYIIYGPVTRVLEDAEYFTEPIVYWFISPLIYVQIAVTVIFFLLFGWYLQHRFSSNRLPVWTPYALLLAALNSVYIFIYFSDLHYGAYIIHPIIFLLLSIISLLPQVYYWYHHQSTTINTVVFSSGLLILLPTLYLIGRWIVGDQWDVTQGVRFDVFLLISGLISLILFGVYITGKNLKNQDLSNAFTQPLNLSLFVGHLIDGITSYVSIYDPLNMGLPAYIEKHPGSDFLLELWPPLFPIVKFLLIVLIIYFFDVVYKKELYQYSRLVNLLKIGILILGFSPGVRDLLRVTMGV